jgi:hypothetical protein
MREPGSYRVGWARDEVRKTIQQSRPPTFDSFYRLVDLRRILSEGGSERQRGWFGDGRTMMAEEGGRLTCFACSTACTGRTQRSADRRSERSSGWDGWVEPSACLGVSISTAVFFPQTTRNRTTCPSRGRKDSHLAPDSSSVILSIPCLAALFATDGDAECSTDPVR